jgi:hypothetical protein
VVLRSCNGRRLPGKSSSGRKNGRHSCKDRRRILARRYLFQLGDAVDSLQHRVDNWAHRGGLEFSEGKFPGYWEVTSLYAVARALGAERILDLEGVYVELRAISPDEAAKLPQHAVEQAVTEAFGFSVTIGWLSPNQSWTGPVTSSGS